MLLFEQPAFDLVQDPDGEEGVLVDRVVVVHVVLHLSDDMPEIGDEAAEDAGLVHPPQCGFRILARGEDFEEQAVRLRIPAQPLVDQVRRLTGRPQRARMDVEPVLLRDMKEPQERHRVFREKIFSRYRQPLAVEHKAGERPPPSTPTHPGEPALALLVGFEDRAEDPGQVADILGDQEIIFHEALDPAAPRIVGVTHPPSDLCLQVESQPLFGPAGQIVKMAADRPQEPLGVVEPLRLLRREHAQIDQLADIVDAVDVFGDPEQRVQVSAAHPCLP